MKTRKNYTTILSKKQNIILAFVLFMTNILFAQTGSLSGVIKDSEGELLFGAIIQVKGTQNGAQSDFDGNYSIQNIPVGPQIIVFDYMGDAKEQEVTIEAGSNTLDYQFGENALMLDEVVIFVERDPGSDAAVIDEQVNSEEVVEIMGSDEMKEKGLDNVAASVGKIAGVSKTQGGGQVFVRGLEDRYNNAFLNGLPVPSPDPDLKVIPLGIFPTSVVKNIAVSKVFNEKYYADYSGASIDIKTKTYTDTVPLLEIGLSGNYNTVSTFKDFYTHADGQSEFFGIDGGNRDQPAELSTFDEQGNAVDQFTSTEKDPFSTSLNPSLQKALPGMGLSLSAGKFFAFTDKRDTTGNTKDINRGIGLLLSLSTGNKYSSVFDGISRSYSKQNDSLSYLRFNKYSLKTSTSLIGSAIYKLNAKSNIIYNLLYINDTENFTIEREGYFQDLGRENYVRRNTYFLNNVMNNQVLGTHEGDKFDVLWGLSYGIANSAEKDRKELTYHADPEGYSFNGLNRANNHRFWSALQENEYAARGELKYHLYGDTTGTGREDSLRGNLKIGVNARTKRRVFDFDQVNYELSASSYGEGAYVNDVYTPASNLSNDSLNSDAFFLIERVAPESEYNADLDVYAAYAGIDYDLTEKFKLLGGIRLEKSKQVINFKTLRNGFSKEDFQTAEIDTFNVFPSLGFKYTPKEKTNIRFATSQTVTRPKFTEVAPFLRQNRDGDEEVGNPNLQNAYSYNGDLKYETSKNSGELMSITLFGRYLADPIERIAQASSSTIYSYQNIEQAIVGGAELEVNKKLSNILYPKNDTLEHWSKNMNVGGNFSYMYSQVVIPDELQAFLTNTKRPLQGASPYLVNFDLGYDLKTGKDTTGEYKNTTTISLVYNVFGRRLFAAGVQGVGDVYEAPVNTLDLVIKSKIGEKLSLGFKARNLLNPTIQRESEAIEEDRTLILNSYKRGVSFSFSIGYKF